MPFKGRSLAWYLYLPSFELSGRFFVRTSQSQSSPLASKSYPCKSFQCHRQSSFSAYSSALGFRGMRAFPRGACSSRGRMPVCRLSSRVLLAARSACTSATFVSWGVPPRTSFHGCAWASFRAPAVFQRVSVQPHDSCCGSFAPGCKLSEDFRILAFTS